MDDEGGSGADGEGIGGGTGLSEAVFRGVVQLVAAGVELSVEGAGADELQAASRDAEGEGPVGPATAVVSGRRDVGGEGDDALGRDEVAVEVDADGAGGVGG